MGDLYLGHAPSWHDYSSVIVTPRHAPHRAATISAFRQGRSDPTFAAHGTTFWRATLTPDGPATLQVSDFLSDSPVVDAFGPGADWIARTAHGLLGELDQIPELTAVHPAVATAQRSWSGLRLGRSNVPYHELLPTVLAQRVTAREALSQWRAIVRAHGTTAPGPRTGLFIPPEPETLARLPYFELHSFGIDRRRAECLIAVARHAHVLLVDHDASTAPERLTESLRRIPGVGQWTAACAGGLAFGDPDALQVGDFHVKNTVVHALTGRIRGTDEEMVELLSPYAGHRHRVVRWLQMDGHGAPARGPRRPIVSIARF